MTAPIPHKDLSLFLKLPESAFTHIFKFIDNMHIWYAMKEYLLFDENIDYVDRKKTLIRGFVQSGKSAAIVRQIKLYSQHIKKFIIVPNTLISMNQYVFQTFKEFEPFRVCEISTHTNLQQFNKADIFVIMNNKFRIQAAFNLINQTSHNFILLADESDLICSHLHYKTLLANHPKKIREFHISATPSKTQNYQCIYQVPVSHNYYGLNRLNICFNDDILDIVQHYANDDKAPPGIMLINRLTKFDEMFQLSKLLAKTYPNIPCVLLAQQKTFYHNMHSTNFTCSVKSIIDTSLTFNTHKLFVIAYRLSSRCVSFTSSNFAFHITHQVSKLSHIQPPPTIISNNQQHISTNNTNKEIVSTDNCVANKEILSTVVKQTTQKKPRLIHKNTTQFVQLSRICGIYNNITVTPTLFLTNTCNNARLYSIIQQFSPKI